MGIGTNTEIEVRHRLLYLTAMPREVDGPPVTQRPQPT